MQADLSPFVFALAWQSVQTLAPIAFEYLPILHGQQLVRRFASDFDVPLAQAEQTCTSSLKNAPGLHMQLVRWGLADPWSPQSRHVVFANPETVFSSHVAHAWLPGADL